MKKLILPLLFTSLQIIELSAQQSVKYPFTQKQIQTDDYFGTKVPDPYRWLEDDRSAQTAEWVKAQNKVSSAYLKGIPSRDKLRDRLSELWNYNKQSAPYKKGELFFCSRNNGLQNQSVLYVMKDLYDKGEILLDPNTLSTDGTVALSSISISHDAKTLAYGISKAGSDWVEVHFRDIATKTDLPDVLKWIKFSGISWLGNSVYYSRYDAPKDHAFTQKNQFHKVYLHRLGETQEKDRLIFEDREHADYNFGAWVSDDQRFLFLSTSQSTSGEKLMVKDLTDTAGKFVSISDNFDFEYSIVDNDGPRIYLLTNMNAPKYKLMTLDVVNSEIKNWNTLIPETGNLLESVNICNYKIMVSYLQDVTSHLYWYEMNGKLQKEIPLPGICRLSAFHSDKKYDFATYSISQFTGPEQTFYLDGNTLESKLIFSPDCKFDSKNYITEQVFYESTDGSVIPMFITHKKGMQMNEQTPCFVYGYGGFNISIAPEFRIDRALFLEAGGIYCVPTLRGGGEYGEEWHKAGTKCLKQNVFDDFIAACEYLVVKKYTSYEKIAIHGRSNGGLLVGAVMTQRPDICKVAIPAVGVLDMLRFHLFTIGRAWTVDYGSSDNKKEFECLYKYSPLHNIKPVNYPATLVLTGDHDDRVVPAHSFKFAATLQEKNAGTNPCLIRIDVNAGHGAGKPTAKQIDEFADMWSFVFHNLGMK